jgi:cell division protein FtsW (lipid II flippase)
MEHGAGLGDQAIHNTGHEVHNALFPASRPLSLLSISRFASLPPISRSASLLLAFPLLFATIAFAQLSLVETGRLTLGHFIPVGVLSLCLVGAGWTLNRWQPYHDRLLLPLVGMLSGLGLAEVARLAPSLSPGGQPGGISLVLPSFLLRQLIWLVLGTLVLLAVGLAPRNLRWLRRYRYTWLFAGLALLALTLVIGVNPSGFGARLWLGARGVYIQPSELLKLLMLVFLASYLEDRRQVLLEVEARIGRWQLPHPAYLGPMLLMWGFSMLLLIWQRDLGAALLFFGVFLAMLYAATGQGRYVLTGTALLVVAAIVGYRLFDHVALRVDAWWNPWQEASGRSFQIVQSLLAFANGGVLGQGLGQGLPTAIPVVHTDFVFAAIGEEYGLVGTLAVIVCFALLVGRAFHIALGARRPFNQLLAAGIGSLFGLQSLVIMAGTLKVIPLTGVTLPFVSYGGSSLLTSMIMIGLLLHISGQPR